MTANVVNLRQARKQRRRRQHEQEAGAARARHGTSGGEKRLQSLESDRARREHDGRRREPARNGDDDGTA